MDDNVEVAGAAAMPLVVPPRAQVYNHKDQKLRVLVPRGKARRFWGNVVGLPILAILMGAAAVIVAAPFVLAWQGQYAWAAGIAAPILGGVVFVWYGILVIKQDRVQGE